MADAVISGWPEAPSSPVQGRGALLAAGAGCACAEVPGRGAGEAVWPGFESAPVKRLSNRFSGLPDDCARASPPSSTAAASKRAPVCLAAGPFRRVMFHPSLLECARFQEASSRFPIA